MLIMVYDFVKHSHILGVSVLISVFGRSSGVEDPLEEPVHSVCGGHARRGVPAHRADR